MARRRTVTPWRFRSREEKFYKRRICLSKLYVEARRSIYSPEFRFLIVSLASGGCR